MSTIVINIVLIVLGAAVLLAFLWPRDEEDTKKEQRCACSNCECKGEEK